MKFIPGSVIEYNFFSGNGLAPSSKLLCKGMMIWFIDA